MTDAKFFHLYTGPLDVNTYIVINAQSGFVVDPGGNAEDIFAIFKKQKAKVEAILLTHAHFDHIGGVAELCRMASKDENGNENLQNSPAVFLHKDDLEKIGSYKNMGFSMGINPEKFTPDVLLCGGEKLKIAGLDVDVIHTPGHSKGSVCYVVGNKIFVGDTLFFMSFGLLRRKCKRPQKFHCKQTFCTQRKLHGFAGARRADHARLRESEQSHNRGRSAYKRRLAVYD